MARHSDDSNPHKINTVVLSRSKIPFMYRTLVSGALALSLFTVGCKKETEQADRFIINGLHDVEFNSSATSNILPIQVQHMNGTQETVGVSVEGLPDGFWAAIEPNSGTPTFGSIITIHQSGTGPGGGTYPFKVIAKSASFTKTYALNLILQTDGYTIKPYNGGDTLELSKTAYMYMSIDRTSGRAPEQTTLSVSNLPATLRAQFSQETGRPPFSTIIKFQEQNGILQEGYYSFTLNAKSPTFTASRKLTVHAGPWSGYIVDGSRNRTTMERSKNTIELSNVDNDPSVLPNEHTIVTIGLTGDGFPTSDGVYTYTVGGSRANTNVSISYRYSASAYPAQTTIDRVESNQLKLTVAGGKYHVQVDDVLLTASGSSKTISIDASE
jgi:hypothetical protein